MEEVSYSVESKPENVRFISDRLENFCHNHHFEKDIISNIVLATDEALSNIVLHSYDDLENGKIDIQICFDDNELTIILIDYGKPLNPQKLIPNKPKIGKNNYPIGGFGLFLIHKFMDKVSFTRDDTKKKNILKLKKTIKNKDKT